MCQWCTWCLLMASDLITTRAVGMCVQQQAQVDPGGLQRDTVVHRQELSCTMHRPHSKTRSTLFTSTHVRAASTTLPGMQQSAKKYAACCSCWASLPCMSMPACASVQVASDTATLSRRADSRFEQAALLREQGSMTRQKKSMGAI